jgi:dienelactone hydrolase
VTRKRIVATIAVIAVVAILAIGGKIAWSRYGPIPGPDATVTHAVLDGQAIMMAVPPHPNGRLILWAHGYAADQNEILTERQAVPLRNALLKAGYILAGTDGHGNAFGNDASIVDLLHLDQWVSARQTITGTYLVGESMGGLSSLLVLPKIPDVKGWIGVYPACNLATVAAAYPEVGPAYGTSHWVPADAPDRSPVRINGPAYRNLPMLFLASNSDTVVSKAKNTDLCAAEARADGARVTVITTQGNHGDKSNFRPDPILAFLSRGS